jgi:hypothetical protein
MGLKLGDEIVWDVQGVPIRSRIGSIRAVEWRRLEPNFFVVFPEGVLEPAPKFHVAAVRAENSDHSARVQRAVVSAFPNVTAIDLALVMETVDGIFSKVAFVIQFMAAFTVLTGIIVLAGAVLTGRFQRIRETVLLRTLGATRAQLQQIQVVGIQPLQRSVHRLEQAQPRGAGVVGAVAQPQPGLAGQDHLVAAAAQRFAEDGFGRAVGIDIGGVEEIDAGFDGQIDHAACFGDIGVAPGAEQRTLAAEGAGTEAERGDFEAGTAEKTGFHGMS